MSTLRRELIQKISNVIKNEAIFCSDGLENEVPYKEMISSLSEKLADSVLELRGFQFETKPDLTPEEIEEVSAKVGVILTLNKGQALTWKGREFFREDHLHYADWWNNKTNLECGKKIQRSWQKAFKEWQEEGLSLADLLESWNMDIGWRQLFTDPNQLTSKAIAIKAARTHDEKRRVVPDDERTDLDAHGSPMSYG